MKKFGIILLIISVVVPIFYSCNNVFNPNAPFRERYALDGIMRSDTSFQVVTITRSYEADDGVNPLSNTQDPAIIGAKVSLWYRDTLYQMRDTIITRIDTNRYTDPVHCYYTDKLKPQENEYVDIEALLPNGLLLQSTTQLPAAPPSSFFDKDNDIIVPPLQKQFVYVKWTGENKVLYSPKIDIIYYKNGSSEKRMWEVPLFYVSQNNQMVPVYPKQTKADSVSIEMETIKRALDEIPQGGSKKNYSVAGLNVEVVIYDENLTTYYLSTQNGLDAFTVRLDSPDYSNITGGYGIFGSYVRTDYYIKFSQSYLTSLGFR